MISLARVSRNSQGAAASIQSPIRFSKRSFILLRGVLLLSGIWLLFVYTRYSSSLTPLKMPEYTPATPNNIEAADTIKQDLPVLQTRNPDTENRKGGYRNIAIAVKTGKETALSRVPVQMLTFLRDAESTMVLAECMKRLSKPHSPKRFYWRYIGRGCLLKFV